MKYLPCLLWIPVFLIFTFPLLMLAPIPFVHLGWWYFLPVGLIFLGLLIVPIALLTRRLTLDGDVDVNAKEHWPDIFWLWGNDEEGCPEWWFTSCANGEENKIAEWFPQFWWYAVRNPVNNHRFLLKDEGEYGTRTDWSLSEPMEAPQMRNLNRKSAFRYNWRKWQSGYRRIWLNDNTHYSEIWIGWKIGSKVPGLGFATQFRWKREIGK